MLLILTMIRQIYQHKLTRPCLHSWLFFNSIIGYQKHYPHSETLTTIQYSIYRYCFGNIIYWYNFTIWTAVFLFILVFLFSVEMVTTYINENRLNDSLRNIKTIKTATQSDMWMILKDHDWWRFYINENL